MRATMADSAELCAPWRTEDVMPDTGAIAYVQPFDVYTDHVQVLVRVLWRGWVMSESYTVRKSEWGVWMVEVYSVTYISSTT